MKSNNLVFLFLFLDACISTQTTVGIKAFVQTLKNCWKRKIRASEKERNKKKFVKRKTSFRFTWKVNKQKKEKLLV
jgi:hypothetical protein